MAHQGGDFLHLGVAPDVDLVVCVAVCADQLVRVLREHEVADLRASVHAAGHPGGVRVPEADRPVRSTAA